MPTKLKSKFPEEFTCINECVSTTGKYTCAFGQHFRPTLCYDIVAVNRITGEATRLHFGDHKDQAMSRWVEFKRDMTAKRGESEKEEKNVYHIFGPNSRPSRVH